MCSSDLVPPSPQAGGRSGSSSGSFHQLPWRRDLCRSTQAAQAPAPRPEPGRDHVNQPSEAASYVPESCVCAGCTPSSEPPGTSLNAGRAAAADVGHSQTLGAQGSPGGRAGQGWTWGTAVIPSLLSPHLGLFWGRDWAKDREGGEMGTLTITALGALGLG